MGRQFSIPFDGHQIAVTAYNENVEGVPIVLIHGVLASTNFWHAEHASWLKGRRWYSVGLPAHYPSKPSANFIDRKVNDEFFYQYLSTTLEKLLGDRPAIIVGHSTGGFSALNLAARNPEKIKAIVSVGGFTKGNFGGVEGLLQKFATWGAIGRVLFNFVLRLFASSPTVCLWLSVPLASKWRAYLNWAGTKPTFAQFFPDTRHWYKRAMAHMFEGIYRLDIRPRMKDINVPVLLIAGTHDPVIPFAHSKEMAEALPRVEFKPLAGVGHMPFAEESAQYEQLLEDWIERHSQESRVRSSVAGGLV